MRTSLFWYTKDLRVADLPGLTQACKEFEQVIPVYIWDDRELQDEAPNKCAFLEDSLNDLAEELSAVGSALTLVRGETIPSLLQLCATTGALAIYYSQSRDPQTVRLQDKVSTALAQQGIKLHRSPGNYLIDPEKLRTKTGNIYQVYTPFSKQAFAQLESMSFENDQLDVSKLAKHAVVNADMPKASTSGTSSKRQKGGCREAQSNWSNFLCHNLMGYSDARDEMWNESSTSRLSAHLNFGTISVHQMLRDLARHPDSEGKHSFIKELLWREFNYYLANHFPYMLHTSFKKEFSFLEWNENTEYLNAWKEGRTGFPIVDAAMRELRATGWMHNRARMIVASFLVKDLHINWESGEEYFLEWLTDGDQVQNNAGWQWSASTGADAQPYFRIFNPMSQGQKFDPQGVYVKRWVPELKDVPEKYIHEPLSWDRDVSNYPQPIVDHAEQRLKAIEMFKEAKRKSEGEQ